MASRETRTPMVQMSGISVAFPGVRALDGVDLSIEPGTFVAVVGPSGSGKSTLLNMLGALDRPDSGTIAFNGREIAALDEEDQARFRRESIGFVFQFFNLLPAMTAWENVAMPALLAGTSLRKSKGRAVELLDLVGLGDRTEHRPAELSGGQMQRVAVARALMMDPPVILADEPSGNLDSRSGAEVIALLASLARDAERPRAIVMVTHDVAGAAVADRRITVADGRIVADERGAPCAQ